MLADSSATLTLTPAVSNRGPRLISVLFVFPVTQMLFHSVQVQRPTVTHSRNPSYLLIGYDRCGYGHWDSVYGRNAPTLGGGVPLIQGNEVPQHPRPSQMGDSGPETHAHLVCIHATQ